MPNTETVAESAMRSPASEQAAALGRAVKGALAVAGRTQADLGVALDLSQQAVSRRITGEVELSATELRGVAAFLGLKVGALLDLAALAADAPTEAPGGAS